MHNQLLFKTFDLIELENVSLWAHKRQVSLIKIKASILLWIAATKAITISHNTFIGGVSVHAGV